MTHASGKRQTRATGAGSDKSDTVFFLILGAALFIVARPYLASGIQYAHDGILPLMSVYALDQALAEHQIPPRWFADYDGGYGSPYPAFYAMLFYYCAAVFHRLGISLGAAVELTAFLTYVASSAAMFALALRLWGSVAGGILAAVLYCFAPYHLVVGFVRGAYSELAAFVWLPVILNVLLGWVTTGKSKYVVFSGLSIAGLILTHNVMSLLFLPFAFIWSVVISLRSVDKRILRGLVASWILGLMLSAYFWLPIMAELKFTRTEEIQLRYKYHESFVPVRSLIFPPADPLRVDAEIGPVHCLVAALTALLIFSPRLEDRAKRLLLFLLISATICVFMTTQSSAGVWALVPPLRFSQFPWRFLGPGALFLSTAAGALPLLFNDARIGRTATGVVLLSVIGLHHSLANIASRVDPASIDPSALRRKFIGTQEFRPSSSHTPFLFTLRKQSQSHLPMLPPRSGDSVRIVRGKVTVRSCRHRGTVWAIRFHAPDEAVAEIPQFYFPGWRCWLDGRRHTLAPSKDHGLLTVALAAGEHSLLVAYTETPIRVLGNCLSLAGLLAAGFAFRHFRRLSMNVSKSVIGSNEFAPNYMATENL